MLLSEYSPCSSEQIWGPTYDLAVEKCSISGDIARAQYLVMFVLCNVAALTPLFDSDRMSRHDIGPLFPFGGT